MRIADAQWIPSTQHQTWDALTDPRVLQKCIPGCVEVAMRSPTEYAVTLRAKIAGGACLFDFGQHAANAGGRAGTEFSFAAIGERNAVEVKKELLRLGIPLIAEDVGGRYGRSVSFSAANGELLIKSLKYGKLVI